MYLCSAATISEQKAERRTLIQMVEGLRRRPWIGHAELDTTAFASKLLDHELPSHEGDRSIKKPAVTVWR